MPKPTKRPGTDNVQYSRRIPADIKRILVSLPRCYRPKGWGKDLITISTGVATKREAAAEYARIHKDVEERFQKLRSGPRRLTKKEAVALAGLIYKGFADSLEDDPLSPETWENVLIMNALARAGKFGSAAFMIGDQSERRAAAMEERFGRFTDALLANQALIVDEDSRSRLLEEIALAADQSALKLLANAQGDYSPDDTAKRFPEWENPGAPQTSVKKLTLGALFDKWAAHPEQAMQNQRTINRYRGVFEALQQFLANPDVNEIKTGDIRRYTEAKMTDDNLVPRTVRDVHKAAISSVFNWAKGKGIVQHNPATDVGIKVTKAHKLRGKDLTDAEAGSLAGACLAIPTTAAPQTFAAAQRWCPLICLYTGARIGEIAQLRKEDFHCEGDVAFIRITPEAGTVKTGEFRDVPLHARLLELGLLDFVKAASDGPLFYDVSSRRKVTARTPQSELVAKDLATWVKKTCLPDPLLTKPLHAMRHRFSTVADRAGIEEQYKIKIMGHAATSQARKYGGTEIAVLARELARLTPEMVEGTQK